MPRSLVLALTAQGKSSTAQDHCVDADYWLGHCEGFHVDGPDGRLGVVDHVGFVTRVDRPDVVAVSHGRWKLCTTEVPIDDVVEVRPAESRLVLARGIDLARADVGWRRGLLKRNRTAVADR